MNLSRAILVVAIGVAVVVPLAAIVLIGIAGEVEPKVFHQEVLKASLQLFLIGVLGMLARELYKNYSTKKAEMQRAAEDARLKRAQEHNFRVSALNQLTQGYWGVKKCLHIIHGQRSSVSYKKQMHLIIDHRLQLQKLNNEIVAGMYALDHSKKIGEALSQLDEQLEKLVNEWTNKHLELARQEAEDETVAEKDRKVPSMIGNLAVLKSLWDDIDLIHGPFEEAANLIRRQVLF